MQAQLISIVTEAASTYDLVTLAIVKDELNITDNSKNSTLQRYLTSASAMISQYCNRIFPAETVSDSFFLQTSGGARLVRGNVSNLQLSKWPIQSVTSVTENGVVLVEDVDFSIIPDKGQLLRLDANGYPRLWPIFPIVVVYVGGFTTIPVDVQDAAIRMVTRRYASKGRDPNLKQQNVPGVIEQQWWIATGEEAGNMDPSITDILDNYRVPVLTA